MTDIFDQAQRQWEEPDDDQIPQEYRGIVGRLEADKCEDCGQRKCVCAQLDEI